MDTTLSPSARRWFAVNAVVAWLGLAVSLTLTVTALYPSTVTIPTRYGSDHAAGLGSRLADWFSYFTIWSNIVVAVVTSILAWGRPRATAALRAARLDSVLLITITGLVYAVVLAPISVQRGWENVSNTLLHQVTPILTVLVWLLVGPRGWVSWRTVLGALVIPLGWVAVMLLHGAFVRAYPYPFVDVAVLGYAAALVNIVGILVLGLAMAAGFLGLERLLVRRRSR
ncbi:MAG: Pr6Pr family membrane protein [Actinomycetales bacterium]|nr:Pr6Pr family membrane protein [Candidatus Phosphoribacter baldrii]